VTLFKKVSLQKIPTIEQTFLTAVFAQQRIFASKILTSLTLSPLSHNVPNRTHHTHGSGFDKPWF